jgi:putative PIN family toxin of toxin-antitoxin system
MIKVVIDTNVLVSGILKPGGWEAAVLDLIANRKLAWCTSEPILNEYQRVLVTKLRLADLPVQYYLLLAKAGPFFVPAAVLAESPDEPDNRFYECAHAARADYLITGNLKDFPVPYGPTKIVNARQFLELLRHAPR